MYVSTIKMHKNHRKYTDMKTLEIVLSLTGHVGSNPTISAIEKEFPFGSSFFYFGADENPPGEYLTPQKSKQKVKDFWLGGSNPVSEASRNPTISAIKTTRPFGRVVFIFLVLSRFQ